jgi:hypothetical protein
VRESDGNVACVSLEFAQSSGLQKAVIAATPVAILEKFTADALLGNRLLAKEDGE